MCVGCMALLMECRALLTEYRAFLDRTQGFCSKSLQQKSPRWLQSQCVLAAGLF